MDTVNTSSNETLVHEAVGAAVVAVVATVAGTLAQMALRALLRALSRRWSRERGPAPAPARPVRAAPGERKRLRPTPVREGPRRQRAPGRRQGSAVSRCPDAPGRPGRWPAPGP